MLRQYKHVPDLLEMFSAFRRGVIPLATRQFTNYSLYPNDDFYPVVQHDINWPTHMEPDFDQFKPGQFKVEDGIPVPPKLRNKHYQWEDALLSLPVGKCLTIRLDGTKQEGNILMQKIKSRIKKHKPELLNNYICRSIKGEGKWKDVVVAVRVWRVENDEAT